MGGPRKSRGPDAPVATTGACEALGGGGSSSCARGATGGGRAANPNSAVVCAGGEVVSVEGVVVQRQKQLKKPRRANYGPHGASKHLSERRERIGRKMPAQREQHGGLRDRLTYHDGAQRRIMPHWSRFGGCHTQSAIAGGATARAEVLAMSSGRGTGEAERGTKSVGFSAAGRDVPSVLRFVLATPNTYEPHGAAGAAGAAGEGCRWPRQASPGEIEGDLGWGERGGRETRAGSRRCGRAAAAAMTVPIFHLYIHSPSPSAVLSGAAAFAGPTAAVGKETQRTFSERTQRARP